MRIFFAFLMLSAITVTVHAQYCQSFDDCVILIAAQRDHAFNDFGNGNAGCLEEWEVVCGTPSVYRTSDSLEGGITAYDGTQYALLGLCDYPDASEGVALHKSFNPDTIYVVSLAIRTANSNLPIDVDFVLLDSSLGTNPYNPDPPPTGCTTTPTIPAGADVVYSLDGFSANEWQLKTFAISNLAISYSQLWIRCSGNPAITTFVLVDDLCIGIGKNSGIEEEANGYVTISPNPSPGDFILTFPENCFESMSVYSSYGSFVSNSDVRGTAEASVSIDKSGFYYVILTGEKKSALKKIVVVR